MLAENSIRLKFYPNVFLVDQISFWKIWRRIECWKQQCFAFFKGVDFIEFDDEGNPRPSRSRLEKLEKELFLLDHAEQYVLVALRDGWYPCYNCPDGKAEIFLKQGQVWKYGTTTKGEAGRYQRMLSKIGLRYFPEFHGTLQECLKEEKRKIYYYTVMPENLIRDTPLMRPPGNKQDN